MVVTRTSCDIWYLLQCFGYMFVWNYDANFRLRNDFGEMDRFYGRFVRFVGYGCVKNILWL